MKTRLYRHYKNKTYKLLGLVRHSETLEEMALYETLYLNDLGQMWVRPKEMFLGKTEVNGKMVERFAQVELRVENVTKLTSEFLKIIREISKACSVMYDETKTLEEVVLLQVVFDLEKPVAFKIGYAESTDVFVSQLTAVLPDYHHLGIASALGELQQQWAHTSKFTKIRSYLFNNNAHMLRLNLKKGFHIVSIDSANRIQTEKNI